MKYKKPPVPLERILIVAVTCLWVFVLEKLMGVIDWRWPTVLSLLLVVMVVCAIIAWNDEYWQAHDDVGLSQEPKDERGRISGRTE